MIYEGWSATTLGEFITLKRGFDLPEHRRVPGSVPILGSFGLTGFHNEAKVAGPGVTVGRSGASMGVVSFTSSDYWPLNTVLFTEDFRGNEPRFVHYLLKTLDFQGFNSGSAQPSLNRNYIAGMPLAVPAPPEQRRIAGVLGALDDKAALDRRIRNTLTELGALTFRKHAAGAQRKPISELVEASRERVKERSDVVVLSAISTGQLVPSDDHFRKRVYSTDISKYLLVPQWSLAYNPSRANIGSIGLNVEPRLGAVSPVYVVARTEPKWAWWVSEWLRTQEFREAVERLSSGSVRQSLSFEDFASITIPIPSAASLNGFEATHSSLRACRTGTAIEINTLEEIRDTLLPKLVSGELRVPDKYEPDVVLGTLAEEAGITV